MKKILVPYVVVPAAVLIVVTLLRAWLEINSPDSAPYASADALSMLWMVVAPALMLKKGLSLVQGMLAGAVFFLMHRLVIGGVYALAWSDQWTVDGTDDPVRYVTQIQKESPDATAMQVFLQNTFVPIAFGIVLLAIIWVVSWVIAFRGKRGLIGGAA